MMTNQNGSGENVRVLVVDDQRLMRDGIASLLSLQEGIEIVGTAGNGQEAIEQALALSPDVILMDVRMPVIDGVAATVQLRRRLPVSQILMLTTFDDDEYIVDALRGGACGYLLKDIPAPHLAEAIKAAHRGIYQFAPSVAGKVISSLAHTLNPPLTPPPSSPTPQRSQVLPMGELTGREIEVLRLIAQGASNREIARHLVISEGTVKNHISNILSRLGLRDRTQAAIYAREHGLL
jgi:DNA-binding NarL/FixJ family response regulator